MMKFGMQNSGRGINALRRRCAHSCHNLQSACRIRPAITLVELLVVIVILTTLVGGVIPVLSPNNDTRKIRAAARGLQGYIAKVQAQAARTGRPQGIGFTESSVGSGVALEVFGLEVPPPFAGFSTSSYARVIQQNRPNRVPRYYVQFVLADAKVLNAEEEFPSLEYDFDLMPPMFMRVNDKIKIAGTIYQIVDVDYDGDGNPDVSPPADGYYSLSNGNHLLSTFLVEPVNATGQTLAFVDSYPVSSTNYYLTAVQPYQIIRQPIFSSESPYQLPSGIVIDFQGSVLEGANFQDEGDTRANINYPLFGECLSDRDETNLDLVGILFSPTGAVSEIYHNGLAVQNASRAVLLLGRIENGDLGYELPNANDRTSAVVDGDWVIDGNATKQELEKKQEEINWLSLDSRLLSIMTSSGRAVVSETAFVDARIYGAETADVQVEEQIEAAHGFVHDMSTVGGN